MISKKVAAILLSFLLLFTFPKSVNAAVVINEFSSHSQDDWVELYSPEDTDISGWKLSDETNEIAPVFPEDTIIGPSTNKIYFVIEVGNRLNIDKDDVVLKKADNSLVDSINYGKVGTICTPGEGQTIGRVDNQDVIQRFTSPGTKGATNAGASLAPCPTPTPLPTPSPTVSPTPSPSPTPLKTPTPTPTKKPSPSPSPSVESSPTPSAEAQVLGTQNSPEPTSTPKPGFKFKKFPVLAGILIGLGALFMLIPLIVVIKNHKKRRLPG